MPGIDHGDFVGIVDVRLDVVVDGGGLGEGREHIESRDGAGGRLDARRFCSHTAPQVIEQLELALDDPLVGAEHLLLVLLQRRRGEALAAGNGLLALIVRRRRVEIGFRDLDVVAEHAVEPDFQRVDAGARAFTFLHFGNHLTSGSADGLQVVELRIDAVTSEAAVARERTRLVNERALDQIADVDQVVELRQEALQQRCLHFVEHQAQAGNGGNREPQRDEIAGTSRSERDAPDQPLDVVHCFQHFAKPSAIGRSKGKLLDRIQPIADAFQREKGTKQPGAQRASAHRRHGAVDFVEQRSLQPAFAAGEHFEMLQRDRVDEQAFGRSFVGNGAHMRQVGLLGVTEIGDQSACCLNGGCAAVEAEAVEAVRLQLVEERAPCRLGFEGPRVNRRDR